MLGALYKIKSERRDTQVLGWTLLLGAPSYLLGYAVEEGTNLERIKARMIMWERATDGYKLVLLHGKVAPPPLCRNGATRNKEEAKKWTCRGKLQKAIRALMSGWRMSRRWSCMHSMTSTLRQRFPSPWRFLVTARGHW
jgi:hypothetical protein